MGCCGSKDKKPAARQVMVDPASDITAGHTPSKEQEEASSKEREPEIELDAHLEALANNMDFVSTVLQSSFVSENASLREQFDLALKETTPEEIDEANDTYFSIAEQETALQKFGFISGPIAPEEDQRRFNWQKGELLGVGAFGRVYMGLDTDTGQMLAVKQVTLGGQATSRQFIEQMRSLETEISLLRPLNHPNIVRCYGCERDKDELNIFLELVPGGSITSLLQKFGPFAESMVAVYTKQILTGLEYLHANRIIHRDIKGANILVDSDGVVKLADFGASKQLQNVMSATGDLHSLKGTPYWMAPEVIKQTGHGRQADIWSVGCTVIEMLTGKPPWVQFNTQVSALFHIASSKDPPKMPDDVSTAGSTFLLQTFARCVTPVPAPTPTPFHLLRPASQTSPCQYLCRFSIYRQPLRSSSSLSPACGAVCCAVLWTGTRSIDRMLQGYCSMILCETWPICRSATRARPSHLAHRLRTSRLRLLLLQPLPWMATRRESEEELALGDQHRAMPAAFMRAAPVTCCTRSKRHLRSLRHPRPTDKTPRRQ
jgi:serine/threonine protein kinase